jgi:putative iron-dependent peroxidase
VGQLWQHGGVSAQPGIFALGTTEHCYLEFGLTSGTAAELVAHAAKLAGELTTTGGVNVVIGLRPELWREIANPADVLDAQSWQDDIVGPDGFRMPATQQDAWVWISGGSRTAIFDAGRQAIAALRPVARVRTEITGWLYRHDRDLTGFIDGTENPSLIEAPAVAAAPAGTAGAGGSVVLYQLWRHHSARWDAEPQEVQERVIGRTKPDSIEFSEPQMPADSHVSRTSLTVDGEELPIFRRNVAYGGVTDHWTVFVGFSFDQWRMAEMLRRMAGIPDEIRCALTRYTTPVSGAYYAIPSVEALQSFAPAASD